MITVEHITDAAACAGVTAPLWIHSLPSDAQFVLVTVSIVWIVIQIIFKIQDRKKS